MIQHVTDVQVVELAVRFGRIFKFFQRGKAYALGFKRADVLQEGCFVEGCQVEYIVKKMLIDREATVLSKDQALSIVVVHVRGQYLCTQPAQFLKQCLPQN